MRIIMLILIKKLPVIKKYKNGNTLEALKWGLIPGWAKG
jgi:putative SOS response-associated peptidase YedK